MPQGRITAFKRRSQTPKVLQIALVRGNTLGHFQRSSREPYFRVSCSICQHAVARHLDCHNWLTDTWSWAMRGAEPSPATR